MKFQFSTTTLFGVMTFVAITLGSAIAFARIFGEGLYSTRGKTRTRAEALQICFALFGGHRLNLFPHLVNVCRWIIDLG